MIPEFPEFKRLQPANSADFNLCITGIGNYSDASLATHLAWDIEQKARISQINGNAVLVLADYRTNQEFLTLQGTTLVDDSLRALLQFCGDQDLVPQIGLVPEETVQAIEQPARFFIQPDRDNFDYIVPLTQLATLEGPALKNTRRKVSRFTTSQSNYGYIELEIDSKEDQGMILDVFDRWQEQTSEDCQSERQALLQLLDLSSDFQLEASGIISNTQLNAFIIVERTRQFLLGHFWKADTYYEGIYAYLMHRLAVNFSARGFSELNIEDDMGLKGLREAKSYFNPTLMRKFNISASLD